MTAPLAELIARLEAATEGSRELDLAIYALCVPESPEKWVRDRPETYAPHYTTSIDAALSLVPETANCHGYDRDPKEVVAFVSRNHVKDGHWLKEGCHPTSVPLALCIAALRARIAP